MKLTPEQQQAIETPTSLSVIASAGTGKTTVLTRRFLHAHFERHIPLYRILAFTFTEKAAREMKERILATGPSVSERINPDQAPLLNVSTIHSFCHELLKRYGRHLGLAADFDVFDEDAYRLWLDEELRRFVANEIQDKASPVLRFAKYYGYPYLMKTLWELQEQSLLALPKDQLKCLNDRAELDINTLNGFLLAVRRFQNDLLGKKIAAGRLSFDDLELLVLELLERETAVLAGLRERFLQILVDEFQDVSPRQCALIKKLFHPQKNTLFIVGDPKQSIYGFRGANYRLFFEMTDLIKRHGGKTLYLSHTFRTPKNLQAYFNHVFPKMLPKAMYQKAKTQRDVPESAVFAAGPPQEELPTEELHRQVAGDVSKRVAALIASGTAPGQIAILFYAKGFLKTYHDALKEKAVPTLVETDPSYLDEPLVQTVWHLIKYLSGTKDPITQVGILRNPIFGFSEGFIDHLARSGGNDIFLHQTIDLFANQRDSATWKKVSRLIQKWGTLSQMLAPADLADTIAGDIRPNPSPEEMEATWHFVNLLRSWQDRDSVTVADMSRFLRRLEKNDLRKKRLIGDPAGVRFITIHGAKGLEFDHVFVVPGMRSRSNNSLFIYKKDNGLLFKTHDCEFERTLKYQVEETAEFKKLKDEQEASERDELKRLIYVALTRSKHSLYLFPTTPAKSTQIALKKDPADTTALTYFNDWLYWLTEVAGKQFVSRRWQPPLFPRETTGQPDNPATQQPAIPATRQPGIPASRRPATRDQRPAVLTVTELETCHQCPKKFELKYLKNIRPLSARQVAPSPGDLVTKSPTRPVAKTLAPKERGNLFHEILQYYEITRPQNLDTVIDQALFNQHITDADGTIRTECHLFITRLKQDPVIKKLLFEANSTKQELEFTCRLRNFTLTGKIDKLVETTDETGRSRWIIIDYKTHHVFCEEDYDRLARQFWFQMGCYGLAVAKRFDRDHIEAMILFTSGPAFRMLKFNRNDLERLEEQLNTLYLGLKKPGTEFALTTDRNLCQSCGYYRDNYCGVRST